MAVAAPERLLYKYSVSSGEFSKVGAETSRLKRALLSIGFPPDASRRALIVAYELAMNIVIHATQGTVSTFWKDGALEIVVTDSGPGIEDIEMAMTEGYSTAPAHVKEMGYGAGMGLPNAKSLFRLYGDFFPVGNRHPCGVPHIPGPARNQRLAVFPFSELETDRCQGCTNCIKSCPTEAIRVRDGKAFILEDRCIDCGECIRRCPNNAKVAVADGWDILDTFDYKIALVAPSFYGQFSDVPPAIAKAALCVDGVSTKCSTWRLRLTL